MQVVQILWQLDRHSFWGNNGDALQFTTTNLPAGIDFITDRSWKVRETGTVQNSSASIFVQIDINNIPGVGSGTPAPSDLFFIVGNVDDDFSAATTTIAASSLINDLVVFEVPETSLEDGQYFTLGCNISTGVHQSPGGVGANLGLWLKADGDVFNTGSTQATAGQSVETWIDESGNSNNATQSVGTAGGAWTENVFNFNPAVDLDGTDDEFEIGGTLGLDGVNDLSVYAGIYY